MTHIDAAYVLAAAVGAVTLLAGLTAWVQSR
jgi:hypothetical protein